MTDIVIYKNLYKKDDTMESIQTWWSDLENNKGERAELRRASSIIKASLCNSTHRLKQVLPKYWAKDIELVSAIAATLSHVKNVDDNAINQSFATQMAAPSDPTKKDSKPKVSELRFKKLTSSRSMDELFIALRRLVPLLGSNINILSLTDGIISFYEKLKDPNSIPTSKSIQLQWSEEYYQKVLKLKN